MDKVSNELYQILRCNPHCDQLRAPIARNYREEASRFHDIESLSQYLRESDPEMPYANRPVACRSCCHWGQRKLILSEINFLIDYTTASAEPWTVLYAGAAPGEHLIQLSNMFPNIKMILYDPAPFSPLLKSFANEHPDVFELHETFFDEERAEYYSQIFSDEQKSKLAFISDIRSCNPGRDDDETYNHATSEDMRRQADWAKTIGPNVAMFKFLLPWTDGFTEYLKGNIYIQPWKPLTSTESRLIVTAEDLKHPCILYDNKKYERQMMFQNTIGRATIYNHGIRGEGLDFCYDCTSEIITLKKYLISKGEMASKQAISQFSKQLSSSITSSGRTLAVEYHKSMTQRPQVAQFHPRQYRNDGKDSFKIMKQDPKK